MKLSKMFKTNQRVLFVERTGAMCAQILMVVKMFGYVFEVSELHRKLRVTGEVIVLQVLSKLCPNKRSEVSHYTWGRPETVSVNMV